MNNLAHNLIQIKESPSLQILSDYDPTRTTTLRNQFAAEMGRRFKWLRGQIRKAVIDRDCFGLKNRTNVFQLPSHREFNFVRDAAKLNAFEQWLNEQIEQGILETFRSPQLGSGIEDVWTNRYIQTSYQKGIVRARNELRAAGIKDLGGMEIPSLGTDTAIQTAFNQPSHLDRVGLLYTRVFNDLKGITNNMDAQISRVLAQGMADGKGPYEIAELLTKTISGPVGDLSLTDTLGRFIPAERRAKILARTEIIRAHHAATIQEYRNWGLEGVKVKAEWTTAGDSRVCERCRALQGKVFTLKQIEGKIPLHPQCRCIALPVVADGEREESQSIIRIRRPSNSIKVEAVTGVPREHVLKIQKLTNDLPVNLRSALLQTGYKIKAANFLTDGFPKLKGKHPRGWSKGSTWDNVDGLHDPSTKVVLSAYRYTTPHSTMSRVSNRVNYVFHHEVGHGFDFTAKGQIYSSRSVFRRAYKSDVKKITSQRKKEINYFLQAGGAGPKEIFAEIFANLMGAPGHMEILNDFPRVTQYVKEVLKI